MQMEQARKNNNGVGLFPPAYAIEITLVLAHLLLSCQKSLGQVDEIQGLSKTRRFFLLILNVAIRHCKGRNNLQKFG